MYPLRHKHTQTHMYSAQRNRQCTHSDINTRKHTCTQPIVIDNVPKHKLAYIYSLVRNTHVPKPHPTTYMRIHSDTNTHNSIIPRHAYPLVLPNHYILVDKHCNELMSRYHLSLFFLCQIHFFQLITVCS